MVSRWLDSSGSWKLSKCRNTARYSWSTGALSLRKKLLRNLGMNFCRHANAMASSLKLSVRNGAHSESRPCQYTSLVLADTQALSKRRSFSWPVEDASSWLYWWHLGTSTSIYVFVNICWPWAHARLPVCQLPCRHTFQSARIRAAHHHARPAQRPTPCLAAMAGCPPWRGAESLF